MNKNQIEGSANEEKDEVKEVFCMVTDDKNTEHEGKAAKHGGKDGAVLGDLNGEAKKTTK